MVYDPDLENSGDGAGEDKSKLIKVLELLERREGQLEKRGRVPRVNKICGDILLFDMILNYNPEREALLQKDWLYRKICEIGEVYAAAAESK